jgi:PKD repeat protein
MSKDIFKKGSFFTFFMLLAVLIDPGSVAAQAGRLNWWPTNFDPVVSQQDGQVTDNDEWRQANGVPWSNGTDFGTFYAEYKIDWKAISSSDNEMVYSGITLFDLHDFSSATTQDINDYNVFSYAFPNGNKIKAWVLANDNDADDTDWLPNSGGLELSRLIPEGAGNDLIDDRGFIVRLNDDPNTDVHWFPGGAEPGDPAFNWADWYGFFGTSGFNNSAFLGGLPNALDGDNEVYEVAVRPQAVPGEDPPKKCITEIFRRVKDPRNGQPQKILIGIIIGPGHVGRPPTWNVTYHSYHFKVHQFNLEGANDATVWCTVRDWPWGGWNRPFLLKAWSSCFSMWGTWTSGIWRAIGFFGEDIHYCTWCWFNIIFRWESWKPLHMSTAWFRWTKDGTYVGPWVWLGWRVASTPALFNPLTLPDETPNTQDLVVRNLQFAGSPERIPNDETTLDNPLVQELFAESLDPIRTEEIVVHPGGEVEPTPAIHESIPGPEVAGSTALARGEIWNEEKGEWILFVMQFVAEAVGSAAGARFDWYAGDDCYEVNFDASMNDSGSFHWDFGDGVIGSEAVMSHIYPSPGSYSVILFTDNGKRTMTVTAKGNNAVPTTGMSVHTNYDAACTGGDPCTSDKTGMTARVVDDSVANSCGATGDGTAVVMWGDGTTSVEAVSLGNASWDHQYNHRGTYHISYCVKDSNGNKSCSDKVTINLPDQDTAVFDVSGIICIDGNADDLCGDASDTAVANVTIYLKNGLTIVKMGKTDPNGAYLIKNILELPGSAAYTVQPKKNGYSLAAVTGDSDQVNLADQTADFLAIGEW